MSSKLKSVPLFYKQCLWFINTCLLDEYWLPTVTCVYVMLVLIAIYKYTSQFYIP